MKCEVTKLNYSAGLKGAGLEYRRKGHWELEAKNQHMFLKLTTVTRNKETKFLGRLELKSWISGSRNWVMKNTSNSYLKLFLGSSMIKHRGNVQYSELESLIREQAWCWSTKAVGSFIDYQYREEVALNNTLNGWERRNAQLSTYSSLHLSLLFIPTTNFTTVLCSCWRINASFRFKLSVSKMYYETTLSKCR